MDRDMEDLKAADKIACEVIHMFRARKLGLRESMMTTSVIFGRLRHQAEELGVRLDFADALFMNTAQTITAAIDVVPDDQEKN